MAEEGDCPDKYEGSIKTCKEEQIGFHKGSVNTLMAERNELLRIVAVTESLINAHISELEKLGVKLSVKGNDKY